MPQPFNKNTPLRFERKFTATAAHRSEILVRIQKHPAFFREIYHTRQVNNIYFDTPALTFYEDNKVGIAGRKKVRIRWYGEMTGKITTPRLEYKLKSGLLGRKWTFNLTPFELGSGFSKKDIHFVLHNSNLPAVILEDLSVLSPTLINSYQRTYFLSGDQRYRMTFDEQLGYYRVANGNSHLIFPTILQRNDFILELKYGQAEDGVANHISKVFPYRLDKSSKYVNGIDLTRG